jgi:hypothetical protein
VLHLFDGLLAPSLGEVLVAPVVENAIVEPILIDCREFVLQRPVEILDPPPDGSFKALRKTP